MPTYLFYDVVYAQMLIKSLYDLKKNEELCDITLSVECDNREIKAHKVVLSISPYFRTMFTCGFRESSQSKIVLHEMEFDILDDIVNFLYCGQINVNAENVCSLMNVADMLQISGVRRACYRYLSEELDDSSCVSVYIHAKKHSYEDLAQRAFRLILKHFNKVIDQEEFCHIELDTLKSILASRFLRVPDEGRVLEALVRWVKFSEDTRRNHLTFFVNYLEFTNIPVKTLELFASDPILSSDDKIYMCIKSALRTAYETVDEVGVEKGKKSARERYGRERQVMLCFGGESNGSVISNMECFIRGYDSWRCIIPSSIYLPNVVYNCRVIPSMEYRRMYMGVASRNYELFAIGGRNSEKPLDSVEYYSVQSNVWSNLCDLPKAVYGCTALFCEGLLYVLGGITGDGPVNNVWIYREDSNSWQDGSPMSYKRAYHGTVSIEGVIYAVGGLEKKESIIWYCLNTLERYDPAYGSWQPLCPMSERKCRFGCAAYGTSIFVIGGYINHTWLHTVERYDISTNQWTTMHQMMIPRCDFSATVYQDHIYIAGGHNGEFVVNTVDKFNPDTNRWHNSISLQVRRFAPGLVTLYIPVLHSRV